MKYTLQCRSWTVGFLVWSFIYVVYSLSWLQVLRDKLDLVCVLPLIIIPEYMEKNPKTIISGDKFLSS